MLADGATTITLVITETDEANLGNLGLEAGNETISFDIKIPEVALDNDAPIVITIGADEVPAGLVNVAMFHSGVKMTAVASAAEVDAHNEFYYDAVNGGIVLATKDFSNFTIVSGGDGVFYAYVSTLEELLVALNNKQNVRLLNDIAFEAGQSNGYGATGITVDGIILDGQGYSIDVSGANGTWDSAIRVKSGTIKNVTVGGAFRGIFANKVNGDIYIEGVTFKNVTYTFHCDAANQKYGVYFTDCNLYGWTSFAKAFSEVVFNDCYFGEGNGYSYCRPYNVATFNNCTFEREFTINPRTAIALNNCNVDGVAITENSGFIINGDKVEESVLYISLTVANLESLLTINGATPWAVVNTHDAFAAAAGAGLNVLLYSDIVGNATLGDPYGGTAGVIQRGGIIDGNGKTITIAGSEAIMTYGGTIKNITINEGFRGIWIYTPDEDVIIDNVTILGNVTYGINTGEHKAANLKVTNSTIGGWTSFAGLASASFENCDFVVGGANRGWPIDSLVKPYVTTTFKDCSFAASYYLDLSALDAGCRVTLQNCDADGVAITALEGWTTNCDDEPETGICVELPSGRYASQCMIINGGIAYDGVAATFEEFMAALDEGKYLYFKQD